MTMSYEEWLSKFKPVLNQFDDNASYDGRMFETYGDEVTYVKDQPNPHIWTLLDADGYTVIGKGWSFVNRIGYFVCEVPFTDEDPDEIILSEPRYKAVHNVGFGYAVVDTENPGRSICWVDEAFTDPTTIAETIADALNNEDAEFNLEHEDD